MPSVHESSPESPNVTTILHDKAMGEIEKWLNLCIHETTTDF